ncbi:MAG TPA: ureidoglycolate lyase [Oceanospirillaceae bacterium]|nr:ureidoglycolate lyase [Oceanospirillaceae bacterium]
MSLAVIEVLPLSKANFAEFGEVIELEGAQHFAINQGFTERYHHLSEVELSDAGDKAIINVFRSRRWGNPINLSMVEQHPLGSQAFMPIDKRPFLVVVASKTESGNPKALHAFVTNGEQGVNYAAGVWHHPLLILAPEQDFLVVDRSGAGNNLIEVDLVTDMQAQIDLNPLVNEYIED